MLPSELPENKANDIRAIVTAKAEQLACLNEVALLSDIEAVRHIQRKEGCTACFARHRLRRCDRVDCCWWAACDEHERQWPPRGDLRKDIIRVADDIGCDQDIESLSDKDAIRFIQGREGHAQCYAKPDLQCPKDARTWCGDRFCIWQVSCNYYRNKTVIPFDVDLPAEGGMHPAAFRALILERLARVSAGLNFDETVGVKIASPTHLGSVSRKMLLACPKTVIAESTDAPGSLKAYILADQSRVLYSTSGGGGYERALDIFFTRDIRQLAGWLFETQRVQNSGNLTYYPLIRRAVKQGPTDRRASYVPANDEEWVDGLALETFDAPHLGVVDGDILLTQPDLAPILNIDLPVLENTDFNTLFMLMSDYPAELGSFRDFLLSNLEEMRMAAVGSEQFARDARRLEREIRTHVRKLDSDCRKATIKAAFSLTGCAIASWTLAVYCLVHSSGNVFTVLGPGGLACTISAAYSDYLVKQLHLRDDPVYFLWLLGKSKRRA